jgi:hypothetical protein
VKPGGSLISSSGNETLEEPDLVPGTNSGCAIMITIASSRRGNAIIRNFISLLRAMDMHRYIA